MAGAISFSGMASGLDTDAMVEAMTVTYQNKVDASMKQETLLEWKQEIYKDVSSKVYKFYTGTVNNLRLENTFNQKSLSSSNTSAIKLDPSSTAATGTHRLSDLKMATSASVQTYKMPSASKGISGSTTMAELGIKAGESITITDGESNKTTTISFVKEKPETEAENTVYIIVNEADETEKEKTGDTISSLQSALNSALPSASVNFDSTAGAFFISSKNTGEDQSITISGTTNALINLGLTDGKDVAEDSNGSYVNSKDGETTVVAKGMNASYKYNGVEIESKSNNININGLKFTITANTQDEITVNSSTDVDGMVNTIKSFVDEYNNMIKELNDLISAESAGSYEPLLDKEKEGMTDSQIDKWEKKIKDSLLRNDSTLKGLTSSMRNVLAGTLDSNSVYKSLASIGITTSSDWTQNGKLELDEDKLRAALADKPDEVIALFTANGEKDAEGKAKKGTLGLGDGLYDVLNTSFKRIANVKSATSLFSDTLLTNARKTQSETTTKWEDRLESMKELYQQKFAAMEKMMSTLNSQTDSLTSLLNS